MRKGIAALLILGALCLLMASCGETENTVSGNESATSHFVPVGSDEISGAAGFTSVDPEAYPSGVECE